jgi:hypothetical protein
LTFADPPADTITSFRTAVLKPCRVTETVYLPTFRDGIVNEPFVVVTAVETPLVASFFAVTVAPGMAPPLESTTTPVMDELVPLCANAGAATKDRSRPTAHTHFRLAYFMERILQNEHQTSIGAFPDATVGQ